MIEIKREENRITISGHAGYAKYGQDIVCASISMLAHNLVESIEKLTIDSIQTIEKDGYMSIEYKDLTVGARLLVDSFFIGAKSVADGFPDHVKILSEMTIN